MTSIFYNKKFGTKYPVSFLVTETVAEKIKAAAEDGQEGGVVFFSCVLSALKECHGGTPTDDDIDAAVEKLQNVILDAQKQAEKKLPTKPRGNQFAAAYIDWVEQLDPVATCLFVSGFDFERARILYSEVDREDVMLLVERYLSSEWEKIKLGYESAVYGAGGSFSSDKSEPDGTISYDLTKTNTAGMAALAKIL